MSLRARFEVFVVPGDFVHILEPSSPVLPPNAALRTHEWIVIQGACRNDDLLAASGRVRQRRAADLAEASGETLCFRQIESNDNIIPSSPPELPRRHENVGHIGTTCRFPAARAMAIVKSGKGWMDFVGNSATKATPPYSLGRHGSPRPFSGTDRHPFRIWELKMPFLFSVMLPLGIPLTMTARGFD